MTNHYTDVCEATIESLRQQLADALLERDAIKREWDKAYEIAMLTKQQLAAALAACKLKDVTLESAHNGLRWWMDAFPLHVTEADNEEMLKLVKALAIQPDDAALKAWLGEPVACRSDGRCQYAIDHGAEGMGHCPEGKCCMPLYAPKGLK